MRKDDSKAESSFLLPVGYCKIITGIAFEVVNTRLLSKSFFDILKIILFS